MANKVVDGNCRQARTVEQIMESSPRPAAMASSTDSVRAQGDQMHLQEDETENRAIRCSTVMKKSVM